MTTAVTLFIIVIVIISFVRSDADVVLASSTCFDNDLMAYISSESEKMKLGSFFLTFTKALTSDHWEVVESKLYLMSWGHVTLKSHVKIKPPLVG
jgi:hypothetical protein